MAFADKYGFDTQKTGNISKRMREVEKPVDAADSKYKLPIPFDSPDRRRLYLNDLKEYLTAQLEMVNQALSEL